MSNAEKRSISSYLFELAAYLAASARGCLEEPQSYGTFRLIDALGRVLKIQDYLPEAEKDQFLEKIREDIERNKLLKLTNPKAFEQFIDDLILKLAKEAKKRSV